MEKTGDFAADLADDLEDALGLKESNAGPSSIEDIIQADQASNKGSRTEDEMQRLLDELAAGR